ncbi:hypothetical protein [Dyadobacter sp. CY323]|uniref:hypothetical protein n=1 Tax=Dyadobacter sp. CY323 TaxID=2907302 RepID=UPI001F2A062B|nr:hypothetical protein [Dyadobacter sp. CY323]MCE6992086.1 hypothetical protein [Dyadobacter sp. CY323]
MRAKEATAIADKEANKKMPLDEVISKISACASLGRYFLEIPSPASTELVKKLRSDGYEVIAFDTRTVIKWGLE